MKPLSDEEIQAMVEAMRLEGKVTPEEDESVQAYKQLFDELAAEPSLDLSFGFSRNVVRQIQQQEATRHQTKAYLIFGLTLVLMLSLAFGFQAVRSVNDSTETWQALSYIKWPALFVVALFGLIQWADYRFVKARQKTTVNKLD